MNRFYFSVFDFRCVEHSVATVFVMSKNRLEALTDGIFATVMTVLVLSLSVPVITQVSQISSYIDTLTPISVWLHTQFSNTRLSFGFDTTAFSISYLRSMAHSFG